MIHLLKGNIGTGILAMPDAFRNSGWAVGLVCTALLGAVCTHCMHMLVWGYIQLILIFNYSKLYF